MANLYEIKKFLSKKNIKIFLSNYYKKNNFIKDTKKYSHYH